MGLSDLSSTAPFFLLALAAPLAAQRGPTKLTTASEAHQDAQISPDGQTVAFKGPQKIGVVGSGGGTEATLVSGGNLGAFVWSPTSSGLYYVDGTTLKFASRTGGTPRTIATLAGQSHRVWCADSQDTTAFGTRFDPATSATLIFSVATNGSKAPKDLISSPMVLDDVRIDPSDRYLLYREYVAVPFSPREYWRADVNGTNKVSLTGGPIQSIPDSADWLDSGSSIAFSQLDPALPHLARVGPGSTAILSLTGGSLQRRNPVVTRDRQWLVHQAQYPTGAAPALLPADGGGHVLLATDNELYIFQGPVSVDTSGTRVVFAAISSTTGGLGQVFKVQLDRELVIRPQVVIGGTFQVDMPIAASEIGATFLSGGLGPTLLTLPGFTYGLALDPSVLVVVASGTSGSGNLSATIPVPNNPWLVGFELYWQGVRINTVGTGDFTRYATTRIF